MLRHAAWQDRHDADHRRAHTARPVPRVSLGALAAPQLARRSSHAVRSAAIVDAQRRYGNRVVGRVLAREAATVPRRHPGVPAKLPLKSGREIDEIFDANPFLNSLVGTRLGKGSVHKAMRLDAEKEFERAWIAYAKRSHNPASGRNYTEDEAREYLRTKGVRAFQDEDGGEVHIHRERADLGTQLHEGLHLFCDDKWRSRMDYNVNEGVTEFFTRKLGADVGVVRGDESFLREYTSVTHLVAAVGEEAVAAAYFRGEIAALKLKVDGRGGKGTWDEWLAQLNGGSFKGANAIMKPLKA